jgi:diadenosine tetraphosphate (Ap4A) HIT family hydrolase
MDKCIFCDFSNSELIEEGSLCYARRDGYPVSDHHTLVIPKRHVESYFDLEESELIEIFQMLRLMRERIQEEDPSVSAFNVGVNIGRDAGTVNFSRTYASHTETTRRHRQSAGAVCVALSPPNELI